MTVTNHCSSMTDVRFLIAVSAVDNEGCYAPTPVGEAGPSGGHRRLSSVRLSVRPSV